MTVQPTSHRAYQEVKPKVGYHQHLVLKELERRPHQTNKELARFFGWDANQLTPRRGELVDQGKIECTGERKCRITGHKAMTWAPITQQLKLL